MNILLSKNNTFVQKLAGLGVGLVIGSLAGIGAVILFTPQSGEETRAQLMQKGIELQVRAKDTVDDLVKISRFDNRVIVAETRVQNENQLLPIYLFEG